MKVKDDWRDRRLCWTSAVLHNDENSTDVDIVNNFIKQGFSELDAQTLVNQRQQCLNDPYYEPFVRIEV